MFLINKSNTSYGITENIPLDKQLGSQGGKASDNYIKLKKVGNYAQFECETYFYTNRN